ncbi:tRNA (uridine(34)/cytosine(34)/5-carboxymethylaminomethyluridine(34)-2'-O)-methyltransferase TrmL [Geosporobacter ferrireducens]|uniref:Putative tRNA (cytidine(34)-2'-O)-methyltransferase n=1 Tax=Geosporobacter ferrireducens TaxID=1424294 RepID=A0A1D8GND2_9FIRM|nr:tRNA (uridine(34)/cytosine(34)/5-carboxymethylaminomethyluridine(34)-2'-O)-methyltransferase TrmL [Geosporobacter ferrireducens]AOT72405.1 tRNA (uridine(34)/cytosine(34)/5-carboxymethylaminomethyluridine(34)-2'-O)-methyltransferase TrmL [Geosporobacter ferrireducens]MTI56338.1 tRNA (uridine(34)/cytosine(34)/5-carboxymethylaminomethyluridine(34)-2'-O)-methyltransferase TrmL [Geosporobacter ferrireducens]
MALNIVLFQPEIPPNTGNIARSCAATGTRLHLVKPLGFSIDDKHVKRAGLDYWDLLDLTVYEDMEELFQKHRDAKFFFATTKGKKFYTEVQFEDECFIMFGRETAGLPSETLKAHEEQCIRIPMVENEKARSLNLSNSVNIILYEALRQNGFQNLI